MPDTTAPADVTSPAPTPPAPASPAPVPQGPERSLAEYMADHMAQVQRNANRSDKIEAAPASAAPVEAATSPAVSVETPAASESSAETTAAPTAPTPPVDERAQALAEYIRGKRQNKTESIRLKAESERIKTETARVAEREAAASKILELKELASRDPVRAAEEFLGKEKFGNDFLLAALDRVAKGDTERPPTEEERQARIATRPLVALGFWLENVVLQLAILLVQVIAQLPPICPPDDVKFTTVPSCTALPKRSATYAMTFVVVPSQFPPSTL